MKTYHVSTIGRIRLGCILAILALILVYSAHKALGLWRGTSAKPSDPQIFQIDLNTTLPALLLTLVALGCLGAGWALVCELMTRVQLDDQGILLQAPGYRLFYEWQQIAELEVIQEPEDDTTARLHIAMTATVPEVEEEAEPDELAEYLSAADRPANKQLRRRQREQHRQQMILVSKQLTGHVADRLPSPWLRWLYPQVRRPDTLLLYPSLADRTALISEIEQQLARV